jgi:hypothetical protein
MTTTFLNSGENGGGEKEDAKMVREAMEEVVERATKKLNGKVPVVRRRTRRWCERRWRKWSKERRRS